MEVEWLRKAVGGLPERQRYVLVRRHGFDGQEPTTVLGLAEALGVSREQIRALQEGVEREIRFEESEPFVESVGA